MCSSDLVVGATLASRDDDIERKANPMSTSSGKALLSSLKDAANKLRSYLMTTRVDSSQALKPNDMRQTDEYE